jgi:hypothetical protein
VSKINPNVRNVAIVLLIAAAVVTLPSGGAASLTARQIVSVAFLAALSFVANRLYREHRVAVYGLGNRLRAISYVTLGVGALLLTATHRLFSTAGGSLLWIFGIGACVFALVYVFRASRQY